jgi:hypothetical protein
MTIMVSGMFIIMIILASGLSLVIINIIVVVTVKSLRIDPRVAQGIIPELNRTFVLC